MALRWSLLLALMPLLAAEKMERDETGYRENRRQAVCPKPQWDSSLRFVPEKTSYDNGEELTLSCLTEDDPPLAVIRCVAWSDWEYAWEVTDKQGRSHHIEMYQACTVKCSRPQWDPDLHLAPERDVYEEGEEVTLSCPEGSLFPFQQAKCAWRPRAVPNGEHKGTWTQKNESGKWVLIQSPTTCIRTCQKPWWDPRLRLAPEQEVYKENAEVTLSCPEGFQPSFTHMRCAGGVQTAEHSGFVDRTTWLGRKSTGVWIHIEGPVECLETCRKPSWDPRLRLAPDQEVYKENEEVTLSCPEGFEPSFTHIKCSREDQSIGAGKPVYREVWMGKDPGGAWTRIRSMVQCVEVFMPGTLEVSTTSIKLNWTCSLPDACQRMQATCRLAGPSSPPCEAEEVTAQEMLHGQNGTFTCDHLQPFTFYSITISVPASTILFSRLLRTKATVPEKPEWLWLDASTGTLRWQALPSCKGEILGYQLNVTAWGPQDGGFLQVERLRLSSSVTEHPLPAHGPGTRYTVAVRGLTAAGAGAALLGDFQSNGSDTAAPPDASSRLVRDISPSQGTAVLRLRPIPWVPGAASEHQLLVAMTHNSTALEDACSGELQLFNTSHLPDTYVAAVLNLSNSTDFVLGDGTRGHGFHNAPLRPGWDYTALLRLEQRSQEEETFACVCYSFSMGQEPVPLLKRKPVLMALVVTMLILALGILLLFLLFRRKHSSSKPSESNSTIPLRKCRGGVNKLNTQIPVEELLEALKRLKRAELEAEQTEDESASSHGAGRMAEYQQLTSTLLHPCDAGKEPCNQGKNRYKFIIPYDHCRVVLQPSAEAGSDYINASYVDSYRSPRFFIAAQGPLPGTVVDFWQMVWQEKISVIVMLTGLVEQNKTKCEQYWPEQEQVYGDFTVTLNNTRTTTGLITRIFCLQKAGCPLPRAVEQLHYQQWPDHGVPRNPAQLLYLVERVNNRESQAPAGPVLVHCSAGIGRTGTFIAMDFLLKMAKAEGKVDVFHCVQKLREQRVSMVQTKEQYAFLYEVLLEGLLCGSTGVPVESVASHIRCLQGAETQSQSNVLEKEFKAVQNFSELFQLLPCREAEKPSNQPKNRKPGILPADSCRPILMSSLNADGSPGYINAVFANTYTKEDRLIITQLPFSSTLVDFWALVWDYTCTAVVVLNQLQELDKTYVEVWPTQGEAIYGRFHVQLLSEEPGAGFTVWTLALTNRQQPKKAAVEVRFWQLEDWPMKQHLPPHPATIISLLGKVETHQRQCQDGHILVTCWDGASRSGIFCAASFLCEQIQSEGLVDVSQAVRMLKRQRRQLIKDVEQYRLCYELALSYLNSFETYGNFK
ncbi:receptor-type tyrosine-protein phosphatase kappa isoform X2 [Anas platyrhynchos]|uniref:receptor-type tyrosine-protein phosphatase kappa isoform X2 n=1 Tax=Anas platyrhynchos TaxID=8839 RepID=UPI0018D7C2E9|nr:receptor-type tyrosine-protein phosphatase kappa isoform X2 [Anas platyrhynchos]